MKKHATRGTKHPPAKDSSPARQRADVALALARVLTLNRTIDQVVGERPQSPAGQEMLYGSLRYLPGLQKLIDQCVSRPLRDKDSDVRALLLVGAYQLIFMRTPDHATINETVEACKHLKKPWAKGLLNAVLRRVAKEKPTEQSFVAADQFPHWIFAQLTAQYGDDAEPLLAASLNRAPMALRINLKAINRAAYVQILDDANLSYRSGPFPETLILDNPVPASDLPGYETGQVSIQDVGAQWAGRLLLNNDPTHASASELQPKNCSILDACAAPGGKLFHLTEQLTDDASLTALELQPQRAEQTRAIAQRLGHRCDLLIGDACSTDWWSGESFSHILLDAPCSGSGTIRRHPDIKQLLQPESLASHQEIQLQLLNNLWSTLQPGGTLLYCTCSLFEQENDQVIEAFVTQQMRAQTPHAKPIHDSLKLPTGRATVYGWQLLPIDPHTDGFYFARLIKPADAP